MISSSPKTARRRRWRALSLGDGSTVPRSIVLIIDYSGSQAPFIENSVAAARTLVDKLKPNDRMAIVTDDVALLAPFTQDKKKLKAGLDSLRKKAKSGRPGRSEQYSALMATLKELVGGVQRPIIIFQTDGDELSKLRSAANIPPGVEAPPMLRDQFKEYSLEDIYTAAQRRGRPSTRSSPACASLAFRPKSIWNEPESFSINNFSCGRNGADGVRKRRGLKITFARALGLCSASNWRWPESPS